MCSFEDKCPMYWQDNILGRLSLVRLPGNNSSVSSQDSMQLSALPSTFTFREILMTFPWWLDVEVCYDFCAAMFDQCQHRPLASVLGCPRRCFSSEFLRISTQPAPLYLLCVQICSLESRLLIVWVLLMQMQFWLFLILSLFFWPFCFDIDSFLLCSSRWGSRRSSGAAHVLPMVCLATLTTLHTRCSTAAWGIVDEAISTVGPGERSSIIVNELHSIHESGHCCWEGYESCLFSLSRW